MPFEQYANDASTTTSGAITNSQTSLPITSGTGFPPSGIFRIRVSGNLTSGGTGTELMTVTTGGAGLSTWTVVRGAEAPWNTGLDFAAGALVECVVTARAMVNSQFYDVRAYGAKLDVMTHTDAAMTNGSATVASAGSAFNSQDVGKLIQVSGAGAGGAMLYGTISSVTDSTHVVMSVTAGTTVSSATLKYGSDDTAAFTAAITDVNAAGGGILFYPAGEAFTGQLTLYSRMHHLGSGIKTTVLTLKPGSNADLLRGLNYATLAHDSSSGAGILQFSIRNLTFDGNRLGQQAPLATPGAPTVANTSTGGTLPAGTYTVKVARLTANGATLPSVASSGTTTTGTTSKITVTFPSTVTGQTGWRVFLSPNYYKYADVGLVATTDITSNTLTTYDARSADDAGRCVAVFGYDYVVDNIVCKQAAGDGFYSEWGSTDTMADPSNDWMESLVSNMKCRDNGASGLVWNGPHDSIISNVISAFNSTSTSFTFIGIHCAGSGYSTLFNQCHSFGNHAYAWKTEGNFFLNSCVGEGAGTSQLWVAGDSVMINAGDFFSGGGGSTKGIQIGSASYSPANTKVSDALVTGFTTGTAIDFTFAGVNTKLTAFVSQASGNAYTGTIPADAEVDVFVYGGSTTPSIQQFKGRVTTTTTPAVTAAAVAGSTGAGTSPPAPVVVINSTDTRGEITFGTGSGTVGTGAYVTVSFANSIAYPRTPVVMIAPGNQATAVKQPYITGRSTTQFQIGLGVAGALSQANTTYSVMYWVIG